MSLTGNLDVFPIEEVLRLLARSRKTGCLRVESVGLHGRVFLAGGALTFATTATDEEVRRQLVNAGLVVPDDLRKVDVAGASIDQVLAPGSSAAALTDFVREQVVESLYRIRKAGKGSFDFLVDLTPRYPTGQSFDAEVAVSEADRRATEWADIESVIPDLDVEMKMTPELPDDTAVTVNPSTWRVLAAFEAGASARQLADRLGLSQFRAAREMAELVRTSLIGEAVAARAVDELPALPVEQEPAMAVDEPAPWETTSRWDEPEPQPEVTPAADTATEIESPWSEDSAETTEAVEDTDTADEDDWSRSWEQTPADANGWEQERTGWEHERTGWEPERTEEPSPEPAADSHWYQPAGEASEQPVEAAVEPQSDRGWWSDAVDDENDAETGDDTDRFLESVFSQLNEPEAPKDPAPEEEEQGFGLGLLRRRRMGAAAKDITDPMN